MALKWFSGGDFIDKMKIYGVGYNKVYMSAWNVVNAINMCPSLKISFLNHYKQQKITSEFVLEAPSRFNKCFFNVYMVCLCLDK